MTLRRARRPGEHTPLSGLTNSEETAIIQAALSRADIHLKRIRHYRGPVIITMDRPEKCEGEFLQIENLAWKALDAAPNARNLCNDTHVFSQFHSKLAAGYERFSHYWPTSFDQPTSIIRVQS